ncbi:DRTGG domain protein [Ruminiclostridium papyrosolvens DSM 2782]|uniref:DRTGG domain protein n=1 Tax=Ruminiclostridium papyrosolvens DSM 2782 TaxID=588581 RepID=F1T9L8_9FIRM|nr:DRTGG domain-containing protein [Ruminiclostridium papyrosolvens]EGD49200.1 DRTGG domain protein [Ruminiclostridium papyrosolvens DSM 2782]WES35678.1 DRTGG domain-containing protein [Ruminiclostridium papyrosolvens DSM 2782]
MTLEKLLQKIDGKVITENTKEITIDNIYICDLLSWVMSHAKKGDAWITVLTNVNVPAVALLAEVACVIIPEDIPVEELTLRKAKENGIIIIGTQYSAFDICKKFIEQ